MGSFKAIFIPSIGTGGAERVAVNLMKKLNFDYLILLDDTHIAYPIPLPKERIISIKSPASQSLIKKFINLPIRYFRLKRVKSKYKITTCLSLLEPANFLNVITKGKDKVILSFRAHYSQQFSEDPFLGNGLRRVIIKFFYRIMFKTMYNKSDIMVAISKAVKKDLIENFGLSEDKLVVIYNPIFVDELKELSREPLGEYETIFNYPVLITAGRLTKQKGQWYLLRIFKELKKEFPELKLLILGEGELKEYLTGLSKDLGLKTYVWDKDQVSESFDVYFLGFQKNPFKFIARSKLFVFPSFFEGFPNALAESMACGTAVVSADCRSGPREILAPNTDFEYQTKEPEYAEYGVLMPVFEVKYKRADEPLDEIERIWVETLKELLRREELIELYRHKALQRARDFDIEKIVEEWKNILGK